MTAGIPDELVQRLTAYQDRLDEAEARGPADLARVFAEAPPGIGAHEIDTAMRVVRANDEDLRLLGYSREEFVGRSVLDFIVMDETARRAIDGKIAGHRELKAFMRTFRRQDGSAVPLVLLDRCRKDASGQVVGLRTVLTEARPAR